MFGYSLVELRQTVAEGGSLDGLRARTSATGQGEAGSVGDRAALPAYSKEEFHKRLVSFIVADDQVSRSNERKL